jgi:hypothetical protein
MCDGNNILVYSKLSAKHKQQEQHSKVTENMTCGGK